MMILVIMMMMANIIMEMPEDVFGMFKIWKVQMKEKATQRWI